MVTIKWIGQSGYIISDGKTEICIDPYLSDVVNRVANRPRMVEAPFSAAELRSNAVICTHDHLDHLDTDSIPLMKKENMFFLAPSDAEKKLSECGVINYKPFDEGTVYEIGDFTLEAVYAHHSVPAIGIILRHGEYTLYFSGDTEYSEKLEDLKKFHIDIMFICINGRLGNMNADEAVSLTNIIKPRVGIPTHYGMFASNTEDPQKYLSRIECGFKTEYLKEYTLKEILSNV